MVGAVLWKQPVHVGNRHIIFLAEGRFTLKLENHHTAERRYHIYETSVLIHCISPHFMTESGAPKEVSQKPVELTDSSFLS